MTYLLPYHLLWKGAVDAREEYQRAVPFPHAVIDGLIPEETLRHVIAEFPNVGSSYWRQPDSNRTQGKQVAAVPMGHVKDMVHGPHTRRLLWELQSEAFLHFLRILTGIDGLMGDPYLVEGGLHQIKRCGFLAAHADFSHHHFTGLQRRVNVLIYLNDEWQESWNGLLNLYGTDGVAKQKILPLANRCVIFSTSPNSFHGHPEPLACPEGKTRKSIALYYYTVPTGEPRHFVRFLDDVKKEQAHEVVV